MLVLAYVHYLSICLSVYQSINQSTNQFTYLPTYPPAHLPTYPPTYRSIGVLKLGFRSHFEGKKTTVVSLLEENVAWMGTKDTHFHTKFGCNFWRALYSMKLEIIMIRKQTVGTTLVQCQIHIYVVELLLLIKFTAAYDALLQLT